VTQATAAVDAYELQLVAAQDEMVSPRRWFEARPLPDRYHDG
jgi:pyridoxal/pyridoxine/pyridoxamine kinase|tara:strand:+ start:500 stop:625 length:126 start_codon:yes stop_codon:yes gene_type:complete